MLQEIQSIKNSDPLELIRRSDVISFDVFDTAIIRPFLHHHETYFIVEKLLKFHKFHKIRIKAEKFTRKELIHKTHAKEEVTILDIYEHIHINKQQAINTEIYFDIEICRQRKFIYKLYQFAVNLGKTIIFTTDITYPKKAIEQLLHKNGYTFYKNIYVSSEENLSKHQGGIYKQIILDMKISPHKILHIGDSIKADIQQARQHKIRSLYVPRPYHDLCKHINHKQFQVRKNALNSSLFAASSNVIFNNPSFKIERKHLVTMPLLFKLSRVVSQAQNNIFLINEALPNTLYHIFREIYQHFTKERIMVVEINVGKLYASSVRTFEDLVNIKQILSQNEFRNFILNHYNTEKTELAELQTQWGQIEFLSMQIRKNTMENIQNLKDFTIYDFTFNNNTKIFIQNILNCVMPSFYTIDSILKKQIQKETSRTLTGKPKAEELINEMQTLSNEETQRYIIPQVHYFFNTLGKYTELL
jgi:HAD superfamily hydrolase (TIGR01549 family)